MSERRPLHEPIRRELLHLGREAELLTGLSEALPLRLRCERALEHFTERAAAMPRPLLVALAGGSGVGKSHLFNTLIGRDDASPVSHDRRAFTSQPIVAANPADRPRINWLDELGARYVDVPTMNELVLIDTPDLNGDVPGHAELARQVIEQCDLVLFVTIPDERADYDLLRELDRAKHRQRWLFVMNKIDREPGRQTEIQRDFDRRLKQLGFAPDERVRYMVSACEPEGYDLPRLREQLFRARPPRDVRLSRLELMLGHAQHAVDERVVAPLRERAGALQQEVDRLEAQVRTAYAQALERPEVQRQLRRLVRQQAWMHAAGRIGWPMSLALGLRNRVAFLATGYHVTRLVMGQVTSARLAKVAFSSLLAAAQGVVPTLRLADRLGDDLVRTLAQVRLEAQRILEDHGLAHVAQWPGDLQNPLPLRGSPRKGQGEGAGVREGFDPWQSSGYEDPTSGGAQPSPFRGPEDRGRGLEAPRDRTSRFSLQALPERVAKATVDESQRRLTGWLGALLSPGSAGPELLASLQHSLDAAGEAAAERALGWTSWFFANLLPWAAVGHVLYRVGDSWATANYLPFEFYVQALMVLLASTLPGFAWVAVALRRRGQAPDLHNLLHTIVNPHATAPLREVRDRLAELTTRAARLHAQVIDLRRQLRSEMSMPLGESPLESRQVL